MNLVLIGEVRTAEYALRGMMRAGHPPTMVLTTDVAKVMVRSGMESDYYCDLSELSRSYDIPVRVIVDPHSIASNLAQSVPDYIFVMGWPYIVRKPVLQIAPCVGMHPTRLPCRRGGAPVNWTILDGESSSAVSLIRLRPALDGGEILAQRDFVIEPNDYVGNVMKRIYSLTEELVAESVKALADGSATWRPQEDSLATYTSRRKPEDGRIAWRDSAVRIRNLVRAVSRPFPGAFSFLEGQVVKIWRADVPHGYRAPVGAAPGTILADLPQGVLVSTGDNALLLTEAQIGDGPTLTSTALSSTLVQHVGKTFEQGCGGR